MEHNSDCRARTPRSVTGGVDTGSMSDVGSSSCLAKLSNVHPSWYSCTTRGDNSSFARYAEPEQEDDSGNDTLLDPSSAHHDEDELVSTITVT